MDYFLHVFTLIQGKYSCIQANQCIILIYMYVCSCIYVYYKYILIYLLTAGLYSLFSADARNATLTPEAVDYLNKELAEDIEIYHYVQQRSFIAIKKVLEYRANNALEDNAYLRNREQCLVDKTCI